MEVKNLKFQIKSVFIHFIDKTKLLLFKQNDHSTKREINDRSIKAIGISIFMVFVATVMLMPNEQPVEFSQKIDPAMQKVDSDNEEKIAVNSSNANNLWSAPQMAHPGHTGTGSNPNYNTSMILNSEYGNAKTQLNAGARLPLRILDKFIVSQESVPVIAELLLDSMTDSGLQLAAGTKFYGHATFQKGASRADIQFQQLSLPNGQIKPISGTALGKDGQPGVRGNVKSDGTKNTAGQIITTFFGGLAAGSIETDILGRTKGGIENGLLSAVAATAKDRAQNYGEKLKTQREWIEVPSGTECDVMLTEALNLQSVGAQ